MNETRTVPSGGQRAVAALRVTGEWFVGQRFRPLLLLGLGLIAIFGLERAVLMWLCRSDLVGATAGLLMQVFGVGLRYDLKFIGYAAMLLAPLLSLVPSAAFRQRWFRLALRGYVAGLLGLTAIVAVCDALFFLHYAARMNWLVLDYIGHFGTVALCLWRLYPVVWIGLVAAGMLASSYWITGRVCFRGRLPVGPVWLRIICCAGLVGLLALCARGAHRTRTTDGSLAYFTPNNVASQLSLNFGCTLAVAVKDYYTEGQEAEAIYPPMGEAEAFSAVRGALREDQAVFAGHPGDPLWRTVDTRRPARQPNVVLIVMESFSGSQVGALGYLSGQTPFFDGLARQGLYYSGMLASGQRTNRGLAAVVCGFPDIGGKSLLKRSRTQGNFLSLPRIFAARGYDTMFLYGGDAEFDNMDRFFLSNGVQRMVDLHQMPPGAWQGTWGVGDHVLFEQAHRAFQAEGDKPFFAVILTSTNHQPYELPLGCVDLVPGVDEPTQLTNCIRYADWSLKRFFEAASSAPYLRNTLFVLVADHGRTINPRHLLDVEGYRVPCLFYGPGLGDLPVRRDPRVCSQTDIGPTILALLGGTYAHSMFGRSLVDQSDPGDGLAFMNYDSRLGLLRGDLLLVQPPESPAMLFRWDGSGEPIPLPAGDEGEARQALETEALGFYYSACRLYLDGTYNTPPAP